MNALVLELFSSISIQKKDCKHKNDASIANDKMDDIKIMTGKKIQVSLLFSSPNMNWSLCR